jgi:RNA polymerase sigma factor (sigma-70 family)
LLATGRPGQAVSRHFISTGAGQNADCSYLIDIAKSTTISEEELVSGLKARSQSYLDYLYDHYSSALYGVVHRILNNDDVAEEVLQDAFLRIWDKIGSYDPARGRLFTWMLNIARNLAIDKTRSKEISKDRKTDDIDDLVNKIDRKEQAELNVDFIGLKEVLGRLSEEQKFVVEYLYLKGYTQSELADEFKIPLGTVKTRLRLAMIELRTILNVGKT